MTRGTKIISALFSFCTLLGLVIFSLNQQAIDIPLAADWAAIIGVAIAFFALIIAALEYYYRKSKDAEENRPYVVVLIEPSKAAFSMFDLVIHNYGKTAAKNILVHFFPDQLLPPYRDRISDLKILKNLKFLPQGEELRFFFGQYKNDQNKDSEKSILRCYRVRVSYEDIYGRKYSDEFYSDPRDYGQLSGLAEIKTLNNVIDAIEKIAATLKNSSK